MANAESAEEFVDPSSPTRLSRRNVLALALSVAGVLLVLFFSSRRSKTAEPAYSPPEYPVVEYSILEPIEPNNSIYGPRGAGWDLPDIPEAPREDDRALNFEQARRSRTIIHATQPAVDSVRQTPPAVASLVLIEGSVIEAALETAIHTGRPGAVIARVVRPVRDSRHLKHLLIPAGTQLLGNLVQVVEGSEPRAVVVWTRMVFPNGATRTLPELPALESSGESGLQDKVKRYRAQRFGNAALLALVGGTTTLASASTNAALAGQSMALELSRAASGELDRGRHHQPVVMLRPGYRFLVYVSQDLLFDAPYVP
ncbi:MAG: TrbI/VirB10 family protein [Bacteroidota bacterium]|nr:TrbI/VirB10 family protein [Bacteroidota bacterium]MDE2957395.1 TrbI/VirB10 family protein [Bacteroidota bacterium]